MPYTKAQIDKIMAKSGQAFVPQGKMNYAGRVAATYLRKKAYNWEDQAASANYKLLQTANQDIRTYGINIANQYGITKVSNDAKSIPFRRDLIQYSTQRLTQYAKDSAKQAFKYASTAYAAGWYGSQWVIDQATHEPKKSEPDPLPYLLMLWALLHPNTVPNLNTYVTYEMLATEWEDAFTNAVLKALMKEKLIINGTVATETDVLALLKMISTSLGVDTNTTSVSTGLYYLTDLLTRTGVMRGINQGSAAEYQQNSAVKKVMWVTSHDNRVCPECQSHDGEIFDVSAEGYVTPLVGLPPDGSHPNCRCTTVPILPDVENPNDPPQMTLNEWMGGEDKWYTLELGAFLQGTGLDSTQV